jgi:hypothetical protein
MSSREQNRFIALMKKRICEMIGVGSADYWEPSDEFILEIIEDETPEAEIYEMARAAYLAAPLPPEDNPSDEELGPDLSADLIRISQYSGEQGLPNIGWRKLPEGFVRQGSRRGPRTMRTRRPKSYSINWKSHCPKYGRQDYRHQASRIEAKSERRFTAHEAEIEACYQAALCEFLDNAVKNETKFTDDDYFFWSGDEDEVARMEEMARAFGHTIDPCDIAGARGYMSGDFERRGYYDSDRFGGYLGFCLYVDDYDPYDDYVLDGYDRDIYADYEGYDDPYPCSCAAEDEFRDLIDRFGDRDDVMGIFEDYGQSEAELDTMQFGQSNSKRGRGKFHYYETVQRRAELV